MQGLQCLGHQPIISLVDALTEEGEEGEEVVGHIGGGGDGRQGEDLSPQEEGEQG